MWKIFQKRGLRHDRKKRSTVSGAPGDTFPIAKGSLLLIDRLQLGFVGE